MRFAKGFLARLLNAADLDVAGLESLRLGFEAATLFALGPTDFVCIDRPLTEDFGDDRRVGVRDVDRLMPLVTWLLIRRFQLKAKVALEGPQDGRKLNIVSLVNQRKKGSCGHN